MTTDLTRNDVRLYEMLVMALALADTLGQSITAIHIADAIDQVETDAAHR